MKHCNQCGTKVSQDARFCQNCGNELKVGSTQNPIDANLKVALTNETTEKVLKSVGTGVSSVVSRLITFIKKLIKPVIIISIVGAIITGIVVFVQEAQYKAEREQEEAQERKAMTFEKEKVMGSFQIKGLALNTRFLSYYEGSNGYFQKQYSDSWPYDGNGTIYDQRPTGKVTISDNKMIIYIDLNRDNKFSSKESRTFTVKSISKVNDPKYYNYGIIETDLDEKVLFEIKSTWRASISYRLHYEIGEDSYQLWLQ